VFDGRFALLWADTDSQGNPGTRSEVVPEIETVTVITVKISTATVKTSTAILLRPPPSAWRAI
jgi:hypothetical protein